MPVFVSNTTRSTEVVPDFVAAFGRLTTIRPPSHDAKYEAWSEVSRLACASPTCQRYRSGPVERSAGVAENASMSPSGDHAGMAPARRTPSAMASAAFVGFSVLLGARLGVAWLGAADGDAPAEV